MKRAALLILAILALLLFLASTYTIPETEQVILTQFGRQMGRPITNAGFHFKAPLIQHVNRIEKRVLEWDGPAAEMPTRDKLYIIVEAFARWRIADPEQFFLRLRDERSGQSRLDDIIGSETRNTVARHDLVEVVRTSKTRKPAIDETLVGGKPVPGLPPIEFGRAVLEEEILKASKSKLAEFGIELLDARLLRINYNTAVTSKIFDRMTSERKQIADRFRSEGAGEAAKILGQRERDLRQIESDAYRQVQAIEGKADADATAIYAGAYNQTPEARQLHSFLRSLETYKVAFDKNTTLMLTTGSELLKFLKGGTDPGKAP
jgi:membrane protease subunit HflC